MTSTTDAEDTFATHVLPELEVMFRVARSLTRNDADAEDLVQDTLLRAFRSIDTFDGRHARSWLLTIMRNANVNRNRRRRPSLLHDPDLHAEHSPALADPTTGPEHVVVEQGFDPVIEAAYQSLPDEFREVIDLVDLAGLSYAEAAAALDIPKGTVMSRLHRARGRIRDALRAVEPEPGSRT
jgi:RNA polymerase sigma-70 factor (ECF subfamily)